jgi:HlyD family secretion protein
MFRKSSLDRLTSPDQIDRLLVIVRPPGWIALICMIVLATLFFLWSILGEIPITVTGVGVFFNPRDIQTINSESKGVVEIIHVTTGDKIQKGMELITLRNPYLSQEYEELKNKIQYAEKEIVREEEKISQRLTTRLNLERNLLQIQQQKLKFLEEILSGPSKDPQLKQDLFDVQMAFQVQKNEISLIEEGLSNPNNIEEKKWELVKLQEQLNTLKAHLKNLVIYAPENGIVLEINTITGQSVDMGATLIWFEKALKPDEENLVFGFFPINQGTQVKVGMKAYIEFSAVNRELYGKMVGEVKRVLPFATSKQGEILQSIPSVQLRNFLSQNSVSTVVEVEPINNLTTPSGYQWTTPQGPPFLIPRGSLSTVSILIAEKKPITYLFPVANE